MSIVNKVSAYLDKNHIHYQLLEHAPSNNSISSAINANIPVAQLVKGVVLEDHDGNKLMAVLPATHKVSLISLNEKLNRQFHLLKEAAVFELFADCEHGAVPPVAEAYHMELVYDVCLLQQPYLYLEGGDHKSLIKLTRDEFGQLMHGVEALHISHRVFH